MRYGKSEAQQEQDKLSGEIDREAAKLIRDRGIPLYQALEIAMKRIQEKRRCSPRPKVSLEDMFPNLNV